MSAAVIARIVRHGFGLILDEVAGKHGVTREDVAGRSRKRAPSLARHEVWKTMRLRGLSLHDIGLIFDRTNSSILFGTSEAFRRKQSAASSARFAKSYVPKKAAIRAARAAMRVV